MAAGDVTVELVENFTTATVETSIEALRVTANDKWNIECVDNGQNLLIIHTEEA